MYRTGTLPRIVPQAVWHCIVPGSPATPCQPGSIAGFYGVYSVYNVNFEIGKLEDPSKFIDYASCGDDQ